MSTGWIRVRKKPRTTAAAAALVVRARAPEAQRSTLPAVAEEAVGDSGEEEEQREAAAKRARAVAEVEEVESSPQRPARLESDGSQRQLSPEAREVLAAWARAGAAVGGGGGGGGGRRGGARARRRQCSERQRRRSGRTERAAATAGRGRDRVVEPGLAGARGGPAPAARSHQAE